jgi:hypothetical protein
MDWIEDLADRLYYIGDCTTGLEDESFCNFMEDATEMAQLVESSKPLEISDFLRITELVEEHEEAAHKPGMTFGFNDAKGVAWMYDNTADIHYFFA